MRSRKHENTKRAKRTKRTKKIFSSSRFRAFVFFVVAFVVVGDSQRDVGSVRLQPDGTDVERGKQIFMRVGCYQCHGREAQGASTGPRLGPNPLPLAAFTRAVLTVWVPLKAWTWASVKLKSSPAIAFE